MSKIGKSIKTENRLVLAWELGAGEMGTANGNRVPFRDDENAIELGSSDACKILWIY